MIKIYTDGSCKNNGSTNAAGAYGYIITQHNNIIKKFVKKEYQTTNNRMELMAIITALYETDFLNDNIEIYTDSAYIHNCITQQWYIKWLNNNWKNSKKQPVKNKDLWEKLIPFIQKNNLTFKKVKAHTNNLSNNHCKFNDIIDKAVQSAAEEAINENHNY